MSEPPVHKYELTLTIRGNTLDEIADELSTQANGGFRLRSNYYTRDEFDSEDGYSRGVLRHMNPDMTPERYRAELDEWFTARKAARA